MKNGFVKFVGLVFLLSVLEGCSQQSSLCKMSFVNYDDSFLYEENFIRGEQVVYNGPAPTRSPEGDVVYTFSGWDKDLGIAIEDTKYTAQYTNGDNETKYTCTFLNYDDSKLYETTVKKGATVNYAGETPTRPTANGIMYTFTGWDNELSNIQSNTIFHAQFSESDVDYTCTFQNYNGTVLYTTDVKEGETAVYVGATPTKPNDGSNVYTFVGWDKALTNIREDTIFTAQYEANVTTYACVFKNYDNTILYTTNVKSGTSVIYAGVTPTKAKDAQYSYEFNGWDKPLTNITANTIFTAQYISTLNKYTVNFKNYDATLLYTTEVEYGKYATYIGTTPTKPSDGVYNYTFSGWDRNLLTTQITSNTNFIAQFTSTQIHSGVETTIIAPTATKMGYTLTTNYDTNTSTKSDFTFVQLSDSITYGWNYLNTSLSGETRRKLTYTYCSIWETAISFKARTADAETVNIGETVYHVIGRMNLSEVYSNISTTEQDEIMSALELFRGDNPSLYYVDASFLSGSYIVALVVDDEYVTRSYRDSIDSLLSSYLTTTSTIVNDLSGDDAKAHALYNNLIAQVEYAYETDGTTPQDNLFAHSVAGVVKQKEVVCEGYALMYDLLCARNNLTCILGLGSISDVNIESTAHAWNYLKLNTTWYCVDTTWGDTSGSASTYYKQRYVDFAPDHHLGTLTSYYFSVPSPIY